MAGSVNKVILICRLGKDPEMRFTSNGKAVTNFTAATSEYFGSGADRKEATEWHRIVMWGKTAENAAKLLAKGKQIYIEGRLQTRQWDDRDGNKRYTTEVVAHTFQLLEAQGQGQQDNTDNASSDDGDTPEFDDIPFS